MDAAVLLNFARPEGSRVTFVEGRKVEYFTFHRIAYSVDPYFLVESTTFMVVNGRVAGVDFKQ
jgi:hypothetical protein